MKLYDERKICYAVVRFSNLHPYCLRALRCYVIHNCLRALSHLRLCADCGAVDVSFVVSDISWAACPCPVSSYWPFTDAAVNTVPHDIGVVRYSLATKARRLAGRVGTSRFKGLTQLSIRFELR